MTIAISIKRMSLSIALMIFVLLAFLPIFVHAQASGLTWVCPQRNVGGVGVEGECTFDDLISAVRLVVNWGTIFALQFSVIVIAYAGFIYMNSGGSPGERAKASEMLWKVIKGITFILLAWLIVTLVLSGLGVTGIARTILG